MKRILFCLPLAAILLNSCNPNLEEVSPTSSANLDFSKYVAVGDFITAGYTNGGLNQESQKYAYPNILAQQFATVGSPATFMQPDFPEGSQMITLDNITNGSPAYSNTAQNDAFLALPCSSAPASIIFPRYAGQTNRLQNLGVPGLKMAQLELKDVGNSANQDPATFNPYFERMLPANDQSTYFGLYSKTNASFFTCWFGIADIANYALSGGTCGKLISIDDIRKYLPRMLDSVSAGGKKYGVIANVPSIKFWGFATIKPLELQTKLQNQANNPNLNIWIVATKVTGGFETIPVRQNDYLTPNGLAALGKNGHGLSETDPLTDKEVLDFQEASNVDNRISGNASSINNIINALVTLKTGKYINKVAIADMQGLYGTLVNGVIYNGVKYDLKPITGGFYSNDNFTPTARGQAIIANRFIQTINEKFGSSIFEVNVNNYPGIKLP